MRSNLLFFAFDTTSKPGVVIATGARIETQEITQEMMVSKMPLLCRENFAGIPDKTIDGLKHCANANL